MPATAAALLYVVLVVPYSRARRLVRTRRGKLPSVLWGAVPIINIRYGTLAERRYGYRSETLVYDVYGISEREQFDHVLDRWWRRKYIGPLVPYVSFLWAGFRYDIFGCFFDGALLWPTPYWRLELRLLRAAGKEIVVYPYGGDARLPSLTRAADRWNAYTDIPPGSEDRDENETRRHLDAFGRYASAVLGCADLVEHLPRLDGVFLYPFDSSGWEPAPEEDDGVVTIVHAPNHPEYKGTRYLVAAVDSLRSEGLPVELELVQGRPLAEAKEIYRRADVIADQFLIGAYALFAIEGMALGKPVVCYLNDQFRPYHPEWEECPILSADPDTLLKRLRELVLDGDLRRRLGARGPAFVRKHHSLEAVGGHMDALYRKLWNTT